MGEDILEWLFGLLWSPLYDHVEEHHGKIAALILSMFLAIGIPISLAAFLIFLFVH